MLHRVRLDGAPAGPAVVLANALGTDLTLWDDVVARLPRGLRVVRLDTRGHGLSVLPPGPWTIGDLVDDLAGVLDALGVRETVLVGLSVGGLVAQGLAARRPDLVSRLLLMSTAARIGTPDLWAARIAAVEAGGVEAVADDVLARWFAAGYRDGMPTDLWRAMLARTPREGYTRLSAVLRDTDLTEATRGLRLPVLALVGTEDVATPPEAVAATAALIPGARVERLDGVGHLPPVEAPAETARLIARFAAEGAPVDRVSAGMAVRRRTLGQGHVDRASAATTAFDADFQRFITEGAWGSVWARPDLAPRERSMLTLALLAALGHGDELAMHVRACRNTGATPQDIAEVFLHVAVYAGVPAANRAFKIAKAVLAETGDATEERRP